MIVKTVVSSNSSSSSSSSCCQLSRCWQARWEGGRRQFSLGPVTFGGPPSLKFLSTPEGYNLKDKIQIMFSRVPLWLSTSMVVDSAVIDVACYWRMLAGHTAFTECLERTWCWWSLTRAAGASEMTHRQSSRYNRRMSIISFSSSVCWLPTAISSGVYPPKYPNVESKLGLSSPFPRIRAEPGRQTVCGAFWAKNSAFGDGNFAYTLRPCPSVCPELGYCSSRKPRRLRTGLLELSVCLSVRLIVALLEAENYRARRSKGAANI